MEGASTPEAPGSAVGQGRGARILVVDDSVTNQMVATALLKRSGYRFDIAANGVEAIAAVRRRPYDAVLMDISMPEMDGFEATRAIRALPGREAGTPIIAMTANAMEGDRARCLAAGMDDYVPKPVDRERLLSTLEAWLADRLPSAAADLAPASSCQEGGVPPALRAAVDAAVLHRLEQDLERPALVRLIAVFVDEARMRSARMQRTAADGNFESLRQDAHALKGSAACFGAVSLHDAAVAVERSCALRDCASAAALCTDIAATTGTVVDLYRQLGYLG